MLAEFIAITQDWRTVFPQQRTFERAVRQAHSNRKTLSGSFVEMGQQLPKEGNSIKPAAETKCSY